MCSAFHKLRVHNLFFGMTGIIFGSLFMIWSVNLPHALMTGGPDWCCRTTFNDALAFLTVFIIGIAFMSFGIFVLFTGQQRKNPTAAAMQA
jgi:hypothetical protein